MRITTRQARRQQKAEKRATKRKYRFRKEDTGFSNLDFYRDDIHTIWDEMDRLKLAA